MVPNCASITPAFCLFLYGAETWAVTATAVKTFDAVDQWCPSTVYPASWIYTGQGASLTTRSDQEPNNHYCLTQSAPDAFASLVTSAELTPVRIILGHCTPILLVCPSTGGEDPAGRDRPGYKLLRMIYGHSVWVWRQLNGVLRTQQLGRHLWKRLRRWQAPDDNDDDDFGICLNSLLFCHYSRFLQCLTMLVGRQEGQLAFKNWVLVWWWWHADWSIAHLIAPVVTTTSIILSSNKIQNGNILVLANPGPPENGR